MCNQCATFQGSNRTSTPPPPLARCQERSRPGLIQPHQHTPSTLRLLPGAEDPRAAVWAHVRSASTALQGKSDAALQAAALEILALMHQMEEGACRGAVVGACEHANTCSSRVQLHRVSCPFPDAKGHLHSLQLHTAAAANCELQKSVQNIGKKFAAAAVCSCNECRWPLAPGKGQETLCSCQGPAAGSHQPGCSTCRGGVEQGEAGGRRWRGQAALSEAPLFTNSLLQQRLQRRRSARRSGRALVARPSRAGPRCTLPRAGA